MARCSRGGSLVGQRFGRLTVVDEAPHVDSVRLPFGRMLMSHMLADTIDELHAMARAIGLRPEWFQGNASTPHYDVCQAKRAEAIRRGAVVASRAVLVGVARRLRATLAFERHRGDLLRAGGAP